MPHDPSRPSWKGDDRPERSPGRRGGPQYSWKPTRGDGPPPARRLKTAVVFGLGIVCLAGLAWLALQLLPTRPTCVVVVASDSRPVADRLDLPLNIYGHRGARDFLEWGNSGDRAARKWANVLGDRANPWPLANGRNEDDWFKALGDRPETTLFLFFSQPGGADEAGRPYLFNEQGGRWDVATLFKSLRAVNKKKFVVFDATHHPTDWRNGILVNRFAEGLIALEPEIAADPNLLVLCASGPDQRSWTSEELGRSVFTHYLIDGLSGGAIDGRPGPITPAELLPYLRTKVNDWVQKNRADHQRPFQQQPFLLPKEADERARGFVLAYGDPNYAGEAKPVAPTVAQAELLTAWQACEKLAAASPGPWVYTPRLWRRYRELLIRYEQFLRAGETETAGKLRSVIDATAAKLDAARPAPGATALSAGLALPAALGRAMPANRIKINEIVDGKDPLPVGLKALAAGGDESVPRLHLLAALLNRVIEKPEQLKALTARMTEIDDGGANRPVEVHLPVMLGKHEVPPGGAVPEPPLIRLALQVRLLAEEAALMVGPEGAHPYSERMPKAVADRVAQADRDRRRGEDLLFAAPAHHADAKKLLESARAGYSKARAEAEPVRRACEVRDRAFAELPDLADWVALESGQSSDADARRPEDVWKLAHQLADAVERLDPLGPPPTEPPSDIASLADEVEKKLAELRGKYVAAANSILASPEAATQWLRQAGDHLLAVAGPFVPPADRVKLLVRVREIGGKLAQGTTSPPPGQAVGEGELARMQGRFAKALLGESVTNRLSDTAIKPFAELTDDPTLSGRLMAVWRKLLVMTDRTTESDLNKTPLPLPWRERLGLVAGSAAEPPPEPGVLARSDRWKQTFRRLARRVELDHWYDERGQPFSGRLARKFLQCLPESDAAEAVKLLDQRRDSGVFRVVPPPTRVLTTERAVAPKFTTRAIDPHFEPGFAALAPELSGTALKLQDSPAPRPVAVDKETVDRIPLVAPEPLDRFGEVPDLALTLRGYYRGQVESAAVVKLPIRPIPDLTVARPTPVPTAQIAARADDNLDLGAIAVVFDCSGSMNEGGKLAAAKAALQRFQAELPQGALVSLWVYGHESSPADDIEQLLPLTAWDRSDPKKANLLYDKVRDLRARSLTPLLDTMIRAVDDPAFKSAAGFKTLLVLTDGCHQTRPQKPTKEENEAVAARFRQEFVDKDRNVSIRMVMFQLGEDKEAADVQFKGLESVPTPSGKTEASNAQELAELLAASVRPRVALYRGGVQVKDSAFLAKRTREPLDWFPEPPLTEFGEFEVRSRDARRRILLDAGDRLAIRIQKGPTGLKLVRMLMADDAERSGLRLLDGLTEESPYVLGLVNDLIEGSGASVRGRFTLEDRRAARADTDVLRLDRPRWVWWEFRGLGRKDLPARSRVTSLSGTPAPTWELASERWPLEGGNRLPPAVEVWASPSDPEPVDVRELPAGETLMDVSVDGGAAVIESAGFERFALPNADGSAGERECLVVRVHAPQGGRYWVQVGGPVAAEVQNYFTEARRSTAAFALPADAKTRPVRLKLVSVDAAKAKSLRLARELPEKK